MTKIRLYDAHLDYEEVYTITKVRVHDVRLEYDEKGEAEVHINVSLDANIERRGKGWWKKFLRWLGLG